MARAETTEFEAILEGHGLPKPLHPARAIERRTTWMETRDGIRLATDVYLPPGGARRPTVAMRTPYGRAERGSIGAAGDLMRAFAQHGYAGVAQDCRGTGDSEPDTWDMYVYEPEDSHDFVDWVTRQAWYDGFIGAAGGSYLGGTQWCMSFHPRMSAIAPEVAGMGNGLGPGARLYTFVNAYAQSVGHGQRKQVVNYFDLEQQMLPVTLAGGYFDAPMRDAAAIDRLVKRFPHLRGDAGTRRLWRYYCQLPPAQRAEMLKVIVDTDELDYDKLESMPPIFGQPMPSDVHIYAGSTLAKQYQSVHSPVLMIGGWYDWGLDMTFQAWDLIGRYARPRVRDRSCMIIAPSAHHVPGYHEGAETDPVLRRSFRGHENLGLLLRWYESARGTPHQPPEFPRVTYYLIGSSSWRYADDWPPAGVTFKNLYLAPDGRLSDGSPSRSEFDEYVYDPADPTPTLGGSVVSAVYPPGSVDVSDVQRRRDVLAYTTEPLDKDLDVVGPLRMVLYASSTARDTDFVARLSDVFPDGRAIQLQNGIVRARYRNPRRPAAMQAGRVYRFEIDMWATANRFKAGHRLRVDISSSDFPRFERNANLGGTGGAPVAARQSIHRSPEHPSHLRLPVLAASG